MTTFTLLFHVLLSRERHGEAPIYLRITVDGKRAEIALKRYIGPDKWHSRAGCARGSSEAAKALNTYLDIVRSKIYEHHKNMIQENKPITAVALKNAYLGISPDHKMLMEAFEYHNKQMKELVGKEFTHSTYIRYETTLNHILSFMQWKYKVGDMELRELNHQFITELDYYFRAEKNCNNNSTVKYIKNFRKVINIAVANGWLIKDPFIHYKGKLKQIEKPFLTKEELEVISTKIMPIPRLELVRDIFLFSCYTGLAYVDLMKLTADSIVRGIDGERWINILRTKTTTPSNIPILPLAIQIINKYKDHDEVKQKGHLLPVMSNQKLNAYLKEIGTICGINKPITFHTARHTFATTVTLSNGVPIV